MIIFVPEHYLSDEYMHNKLKDKNTKEKLKSKLNVKTLCFRYINTNIVHCSDASKNNIVKLLIEEL